MKKVLLSLFTIAMVGALITGGAVAYFSDVETAEDNVFQAGTVDIEVDGQNPWTKSYTVKIGDDKFLKPCETGYISFEIHNAGNNPVVVWKHIGNIVCADGLNPESEDPGDDRIDKVIDYDLEVDSDVIFTIDDGLSVRNIKSMWMPLGTLQPSDRVTVTQSYHMRADTGNWAQGDTMTFDIDLYAEQRLGDGPSQLSYKLFLDNKTGDPDWYFIADDMWGILTWDGSCNADFIAKGLNSTTTYALITYTDPWPGYPATKIAHGDSNSDGEILWSGLTVPSGFSGKVWLVLKADYNETNQKMIGWTPTSYLYEANKVTFP